MAFRVDVTEKRTLGDYEAVAHLAPAVRELREVAAQVVPTLDGRSVWMVSSTSQGGGVAEMLPTIVALMRELGIPTEWAVIESENTDFFRLTKTLHNLIHGEGNPSLPGSSRELYEGENRRNAEFLSTRMRPGDILVVHDPQPMPLAAIVKENLDVIAVWRCHIGLDEENAATRAAWEFLEPYGAAYDHAVFSTSEYVTDFLSDRAAVIYPAINPLVEKNEELHLHRLVGILSNSALVASPGPVVPRPFSDIVLRLQADGSFRPANMWEDIGLLSRPIVTEVSRWDRLKGFRPLLEAFADMKRRVYATTDGGNGWEHRRRLYLVRLVLAGPDPASIQDDPEGIEVLEELRATYLELDPTIQDDVALVTLPMSSLRQNALIVNALQRSSTIVVQNSLREGFGLTITEAMWKRIPVLTNSQACGPRHQVRDGLDGRVIADPQDAEELADGLQGMLTDHGGRRAWGRNAQRRAHDKFLVFSQLQSWLRLLAELV
jgi:trehalose synthase